MSRPTLLIDDVDHLPRWQRPEALLLLISFCSFFGLGVWMVLFNNFAYEVVKFDGFDIGSVQSVREIPGFLAFLVLILIRFLREQTIAMVSMVLLAGATMVTSEFPTFWGLVFTTFIGSVGFHYLETVNQSLQLQWLDKATAPRKLGVIVGAGAAGSLVAYGGVWIAGWLFDPTYDLLYWVGGGMTLAIALFCWLAYPRFEGRVVQRKGLILRPRYWLYYALIFMGGARRQIFMVFAAFMMVEKFGFAFHEVAGLYVLNHAINMAFAPLVGRFIQTYGERLSLIIEYIGLIGVFSLYVGVYYFNWSWEVAAVLYIVDNMLFSIAFAQKTYFQKIADPADQAPTAAVAFTINHIAAVFLPVSLGILWTQEPGAVFALAVAMSCVSLGLACLVPRHPGDGNETVLTRSPALAAGE